MAGLRIARGQRVVVEVVDGHVFIEVEDAGLPVEAAPLVGLDADFLRPLAVMRQAVSRLRRERNQAGAVVAGARNAAP